MDQPLMTLEVSDGVATLTMNRPEKLNAFTIAMIREWDACLARVLEDDAINVVVLTGAGRAFCVGGDIDEICEVSERNAADRKHYLWREIHNIAAKLERLDKPVIAALNGTARGAGMDMALLCDVRFAASSATMAQSYINLGLIAGDGGTYLLPRLVGTSKALDLFWTGRVIDAQEAERLGIVNRVIPDAELLTETYAYARLLASQPQEAIRYFKRAVYQGLLMQRRTHFDMISSHMSILMNTDDHLDRLKAMRPDRDNPAR